ncbi:MAG: hypothetical protein HND27_05200 [Bacteroidetes bacterium]|nr:hypothetical protein [Bacteroidota bacterium]NOG95157.1 hypothetical protein [Bacteroidota bacterium]
MKKRIKKYFITILVGVLIGCNSNKNDFEKHDDVMIENLEHRSNLLIENFEYNSAIGVIDSIIDIMDNDSASAFYFLQKALLYGMINEEMKGLGSLAKYIENSKDTNMHYYGYIVLYINLRDYQNAQKYSFNFLKKYSQFNHSTMPEYKSHTLTTAIASNVIAEYYLGREDTLNFCKYAKIVSENKDILPDSNIVKFIKICN